jgi:sugar/nucleoside kinase (ribokinase family)
MDLVSLGHILKETILFKDGTARLVLGSPAAYTTVCAARLGARAGIVSRVGSDMPEALLRAFDDAGVDQTGLDRNACCTTTNELGYDSEGRKRILRYLKKAPRITWDCVPHSYYDSRIFYCCGVCFEIDPDVVDRLFALGGLMASDIGGMGGTGRTEDGPSPLDEDPEGFRGLVSHFGIMKASDDDVMILTGCGPEEVPEFIRQILSWGPKVVLLTKGAGGTDVYTVSGVHCVPAIPRNAVDTTGAGDCFMAGFLVHYGKSGDLLDSVKFGTAVASFVVERTGGVTVDRMPIRSEVEERLQVYCSLEGSG